MNSKCLALVCASVAVVALTPLPSPAQPLDQFGNRGSALSAFVAVADDASAAAWNPAGFINGPIFNILLDFGRSPAPEGDFSHAFLAAGTPPLGFLYYRGRYSAVEPADGRKDSQVLVRSMVTSNLGFTLLQSLGEAVTVGATLKLVHGRLQGDGETTGDVDLGAMLSRGRMRAGIVARNMTTPTFGAGSSAMTIERHVRAGVAWGDNWPGTSDTIVSFDADLTRVPHASGERRDVAAGAERWLRRQTIAVRGGVRASTFDAPRPVVSVGGSIAVRSGIYVDVAAARGRDNDARWSVSARLIY